MYMYFSITVGEVCPFNGTLTYSFDYAQQVHYPHHAQEVGPLFFKTPRKCQAFGICAEGAGTLFTCICVKEKKNTIDLLKIVKSQMQ